MGHDVVQVVQGEWEWQRLTALSFLLLRRLPFRYELSCTPKADCFHRSADQCVQLATHGLAARGGWEQLAVQAAASNAGFSKGRECPSKVVE